MENSEEEHLLPGTEEEEGKRKEESALRYLLVLLSLKLLLSPEGGEKCFGARALSESCEV